MTNPLHDQMNYRIAHEIQTAVEFTAGNGLDEYVTNYNSRVAWQRLSDNAREQLANQMFGQLVRERMAQMQRSHKLDDLKRQIANLTDEALKARAEKDPATTATTPTPTTTGTVTAPARKPKAAPKAKARTATRQGEGGLSS